MPDEQDTVADGLLRFGYRMSRVAATSPQPVVFSLSFLIGVGCALEAPEWGMAVLKQWRTKTRDDGLIQEEVVMTLNDIPIDHHG